MTLRTTRLTWIALSIPAFLIAATDSSWAKREPPPKSGTPYEEPEIVPGEQFGRPNPVTPTNDAPGAALLRFLRELWGAAPTRDATADQLPSWAERDPRDPFARRDPRFAE